MATLSYGSDTRGFDFMRSAMGANPSLILKWIGDWTLNALRADGTSGEVDGFLTECKTRNATPVVLLYYWGDGNTDADLTNGRNGKTTERWRRLATIVGAAFARLGVSGLVVVENEFNKGGCTPSVWDPALADIMARVKTASAGRVKSVSGLGSWADPGIYAAYPKMLAATDVLGTQLMRGLTKDSRAKYEASAEFITAWLERVHALHPTKEQIVFDVTFSTYGVGQPGSDGYAPPASSTEEPLAARVTDGLTERVTRLLDARVLGLVFREPRDHTGRTASRNYYGLAEYYMGFGQRTDGGTKTALLDAMIRFTRRADASFGPAPLPTPSPSPAPAPAPTPSDPTMFAITPKTSNRYWLEVNITPAPASATYAKNGGAPAPLPRTAYGSYGGAITLDGVTTLDITAKAADGSTTTTRFNVSADYKLALAATPTPSPAPAPAPAPSPAPAPAPAPTVKTYSEAEMAAVLNERDDLRVVLATVTNERDDLRVALATVTNERDAARAERDVAKAKLAQIAALAGGA